MNLKRRISEIEKKANTGRENEALFISWEGNEGCKGRADISLCPYSKARGGATWLPCGERCEGV